jgi:hypothetical protein
VAVLLANAAASLYCLGLVWFVQVVHYPLFARVGEDGWLDYHAEHTRRTGWVVGAPMLVQLGTAAALLATRPDGVGLTPVIAGLALTLAIFALTFLAAVPGHDRLARAWDPVVARALVRTNALRTAAWTAHSALALGMVAAAAAA